MKISQFENVPKGRQGQEELEDTKGVIRIKKSKKCKRHTSQYVGE
jgi:hypothetical protein